MKIKILKCSDPLMWYNKEVGNIFILIDRFPEDKQVYWTREPQGYLNIIMRYDAELINE